MSPAIETALGSIWYAPNRRPVVGRPPLVLIHGAGGSHLHWPPYLRRLPAAFVLAPDLPGHGRSPEPGRDTIGAYAEVVVAWLDAIGAQRVTLCGHSMGGAIVQWIARHHPERVAGQVLVATGARLPVAPSLLTMVRDDFERAIALMGEWLYGPAVPATMKQLGVQALAEIAPAVLHADLLACDRFDLREQLATVETPTLVIGASEDKMTPLKFSRFLADQIPAAELAVIQGAGHMVMLERPDEVGAIVGRFVADIA